ncbi:type II toxin-antitoxin system RelE/ParE family toxin [Massilia sp. B-10]|nr:type II toxin-antitoxin system RelE/ParE family toxin [Massilia sp. B-10]
MAEYRLAPAAQRDLEKIWKYSVQHWSASTADQYLERLTAAFADLLQHPMAAMACDDIRPGYRRRRIERHIIYFRVTDYGIAIIRVLHERMDPARRLSVKPT